MRSSLRIVTLGLSICSLLAAQAPTTDPGKANDPVKAKKVATAAWASQDWVAAADAYRKLAELTPDDAEAWHRLGYALHAQGKLDDALAAHIKSASFTGRAAATGAYNAACVYALRGDKELAFQWLFKAAEMGFDNTAHLLGDTDMEALKSDDRWQELLAKLPEANTSAQAYFATTPRAGVRLSFWGQDGSSGQIAIDHGTPTWNEAYSAAVEDEKLVGKRWRLGSDFWTTLDTNLDLVVAGSKVPMGYYYLTLERTAAGAFVLAFNDPTEIRKHKIDAYFAPKTEGGIEVELQHEVVDEIAEQLEMGIKTKPGQNDSAKLWIHFGPHVLSAPVKLQFEM